MTEGPSSTQAGDRGTVTGGWAGRPPRVLVEYVVPAEGRAVQQALERAGYDVVLCAGPHDPWGGRCPALDGERCDLVASTDVVLCGLWVENPENRAVIRGIRGQRPTLPLVIDAPPAAAEAFRTTLDGCRTVFLRSAEDAVSAVRSALGG